MSLKCEPRTPWLNWLKNPAAVALTAKKECPCSSIKNQQFIFASAQQKCNLQTKTFLDRSFLALISVKKNSNRKSLPVSRSSSPSACHCLATAKKRIFQHHSPRKTNINPIFRWRGGQTDSYASLASEKSSTFIPWYALLPLGGQEQCPFLKVPISQKKSSSIDVKQPIMWATNLKSHFSQAAAILFESE